MNFKNPEIRNYCLPEDLERIIEITKNTGFFYPHELIVLRNLCQEHFDQNQQSPYSFLILEIEKQIVGFACFGPIEEADNNYDLYWMVVDSSSQGQGLGKLMIREVEKEIKESGGRQINIETSSRDLYIPTRKFYEREGYIQSASLPDYYSIGDHKICYYKNIG